MIGRYLLDENLRGPLYNALVRANDRLSEPIAIERVGDVEDLPIGSLDPDILRWIEREGFILITNDVRSIPRHLGDHLAAGGHVPGVFLIGLPCRIADLVEWLIVLARDGDDHLWRDRVTNLP